MKYPKCLLIIGWLLLLPAAVSAMTGDAGVESPLALGAGARALSLGRAYTGLADDANAVYWNPGALGFLERKEITTLYLPLYDGSDYAFASFVYPAANLGTLGLAAAGISTRGIPKTDAWDNDLGTVSDLQTQFFLSYGRVIWNRLSAGLSLKVNYHSLDSHTGTGLGVDTGLYCDAEQFLPGLTLGWTLANAWASPLTLVEAPDVEPLDWRLGAAYRRAVDVKGDHALLLTVEGEKNDYDRLRLHAGLEYQVFHLAFLRVGWDGDRLTAGLGVAFWEGRLDYAMIFAADSKLLHVVSLGWRFGSTLHEELQQRTLELVNQLSRDQARKHNQRGLELSGQGDYPKAMDEFEKAASWLEDDPDIAANLKNARAANNRQQAQQAWAEGQQAYNQKQYFVAFAAWHRAAELEPDLPGIQTSLNLARRSLEHSLTVTKLVRSGKQRGPQPSEQALFQQGMKYYLDGNRRQALAAWERVSAKDPDFPQVRELLQKVQGQAEDHRVEETSPQNKLQGETYYKQGLLLYRQRHYAEARDCWRKVLTVDPGHAEAKRGLERIEAILQALK